MRRPVTWPGTILTNRSRSPSGQTAVAAAEVPPIPEAAAPGRASRWTGTSTAGQVPGQSGPPRGLRPWWRRSPARRRSGSRRPGSYGSQPPRSYAAASFPGRWAEARGRPGQPTWTRGPGKSGSSASGGFLRPAEFGDRGIGSGKRLARDPVMMTAQQQFGAVRTGAARHEHLEGWASGARPCGSCPRPGCSRGCACLRRPRALRPSPRASAGNAPRPLGSRPAAAVAPDLPIETAPLDWPPALAVTSSACGALLLVVGSHGSGAFAAMTLGSVSRYAAVHAACPVVVVREAPERTAVSPVGKSCLSPGGAVGAAQRPDVARAFVGSLISPGGHGEHPAQFTDRAVPLACHPFRQAVKQDGGVLGPVPDQRGRGDITTSAPASRYLTTSAGPSTPLVAASEARTCLRSREIQVRGSLASAGLDSSTRCTTARVSVSMSG